jgi:hypothetical protein
MAGASASPQRLDDAARATAPAAAQPANLDATPPWGKPQARLVLLRVQAKPITRAESEDATHRGGAGNL